MWIKTLLFGCVSFFCILWAQNPKTSLDFAGNAIEELVEKQNALAFNPEAPFSDKVILDYEEYGFELSLSKRPKVTMTVAPEIPIKGEPKEEPKEKLLYQGKLDGIDITIQSFSSEKTLKSQLGSWLNTQQYKHKPFQLLSYRKGMLGQCYVLNQYKVALAQEFQQKIIILGLSLNKPEVASHYERIQQTLNGFNPFGNESKKENPKETPKNVTDPVPTEKIEEFPVEIWNPPSPKEIEDRLKSLPNSPLEDQVMYLGYACPASIYFYIKVLDSSGAVVSLREDESGFVGSLSALLVLTEACSAIAQKKLSEETKIAIQEQDRLIFSQLSPSKNPEAIEMGVLLERMVTQNEMTALLLLESQVGWESIRKQAMALNMLPEHNLFPIRFKQFVYADLVPSLQKKTFESKIENWNLYSASRKTKVIQESLDANKALSFVELQKNYQAFLKKLSFEQKLLLAQTFGVKTNPKILSHLIEKILKKEEPETSALFLKYLSQNQSQVWFKAFPEGTTGGLLVGEDLGMLSFLGYAKLPKGKTVIFSIISDQLKEENASGKLKNNIYLIFHLVSRLYNQ